MATWHHPHSTSYFSAMLMIFSGHCSLMASQQRKAACINLSSDVSSQPFGVRKTLKLKFLFFFIYFCPV